VPGESRHASPALYSPLNPADNNKTSFIYYNIIARSDEKTVQLIKNPSRRNLRALQYEGCTTTRIPRDPPEAYIILHWNFYDLNNKTQQRYYCIINSGLGNDICIYICTVVMIRHFIYPLYYTGIIIIIVKRLRSSGKPCTLECKQIFFKIFYPPGKFEWNTYRLYIFSLNSLKPSCFYNNLVSRYFPAYYSRLKTRSLRSFVGFGGGGGGGGGAVAIRISGLSSPRSGRVHCSCWTCVQYNS